MLWTENASLLPFNTFGLDVRAARLAEYHDINELTHILRELVKAFPAEPLLAVGQGSNLLFRGDYHGTVLHSQMKQISAYEAEDGSVMVRAQSGADWDAFVAHCIASGYYGLENLSLIPGTVGASAVQNIGAYGVEAEQFIETVHAVRISDQSLHHFAHDELAYAYRSSRFKTEWKGQYIVVAVDFRLHTQFQPQIAYGGLAKVLHEDYAAVALTAERLRQIVIDIRRKKLPEPSQIGSAGSFFMNPILTADEFAALQNKYPAVPHYPLPNGGVKVPAAWLIEQAGWKGRRVGRAGVYDKQALVLVNHGGATGDEIVRLSQAIAAEVRAKFGIEIKPEVIFV